MPSELIDSDKLLKQFTKNNNNDDETNKNDNNDHDDGDTDGDDDNDDGNNDDASYCMDEYPVYIHKTLNSDSCYVA